MAEIGGSTESRAARILVIEDSDTIRSLIVSHLRSSGHHVVEAADGEMALSLMEAQVQPIDLVLCDVVLPGASGPVVVAAMTSSRPDLRVIFMSGSGPEPEVMLGPTSVFLAKPFRLEALRQAVTNLLA